MANLQITPVQGNKGKIEGHIGRQDSGDSKHIIDVDSWTLIPIARLQDITAVGDGGNADWCETVREWRLVVAGKILHSGAPGINNIGILSSAVTLTTATGRTFSGNIISQRMPIAWVRGKKWLFCRIDAVFKLAVTETWTGAP